MPAPDPLCNLSTPQNSYIGTLGCNCKRDAAAALGGFKAGTTPGTLIKLSGPSLGPRPAAVWFLKSKFWRPWIKVPAGDLVAA
jgi:hypothetical protein